MKPDAIMHQPVKTAGFNGTIVKPVQAEGAAWGISEKRGREDLHAPEKIGRNLPFFRAANGAKRVQHEIAAPHFAGNLCGADQQQQAIHARRIEEIRLPKGARFGAIVRGEDDRAEVLMPHHDTVIQKDDHIVIFIPNKRLVRDVEKLFQVSATFFG